jgi:alpha-1,2-glucosyltransferase
VAVTFRQTNIIWSLFIVGTALLELSTPAERRRFDPKAAFVQSPLQLIQALTGFIQMLLSKFTRVLTISMPYLGLLTGFAAFVKWNGGIVLGKNTLLFLAWWSLLSLAQELLSDPYVTINTSSI